MFNIELQPNFPFYQNNTDKASPIISVYEVLLDKPSHFSQDTDKQDKPRSTKAHY